MNVEALLGEVIRGALGARGKRHHGALHILSGRHGSLVTPAMLVGALGVAWGLYEAATSTSAGASPQGEPAASPPPMPPPQGASVGSLLPVPSPQGAPAATPPPCCRCPDRRPSNPRLPGVRPTRACYQRTWRASSG